VNWLTGTDLPLTEDQLHQAFFDGMPITWKECFKNASRSVHNIAHADLLWFFRMQQKASDRNQQANKLKQQRESRSSSICNSDCSVTRLHKKMKYYKSEIKSDAKHRIKRSKDGVKTSGRISDDT
jgi:hypothetical protein